MIIDDKYTQLGIVLKYQSGYNDRGKNYEYEYRAFLAYVIDERVTKDVNESDGTQS